MDNQTDWQSRALAMRASGELDATEIGARVDKHPATIRKLFARNPAEPEPQGDIERAVENPEDPLHAFKREAGESVGEMPPGDPPADPEPVVSRVAGTRQTCIDFGPDADIPTGGTLVLRSEKLASGHFRPGDIVTGSFTARITQTGYKEKLDKASEEWRAAPTPYVATITEIEWTT